MKNLKKYKMFLESLKISDDDIIKIMYFIDDLNNKIQIDTYEYYGKNIEFDDENLIINYNWSSAEEGGSESWQILNSDYEIIHNEHANTVYGDYDNRSKEKFNDLDSFLNYIENYLK